MGTNSAFMKDPNAIIDFAIDWAAWLGTDTIATATWTVPTGITKVTDSASTTVATIWLSGGTAGAQYDLLCRITTAGGRTDDRTISIYAREK
jgi:hypothetical protein